MRTYICTRRWVLTGETTVQVNVHLYFLHTDMQCMYMYMGVYTFAQLPTHKHVQQMYVHNPLTLYQPMTHMPRHALSIWWY